MSVTKSTLGLLKESQEMVDLYRDHLSAETLAGVVTDFSDDFVYLSLFGEDGRANGIAVCFLDDVTRIRWGGNERQSLAELVAAAGAKATAPSLTLDSVQAVLRSVSAHFGYVNVLTERMNDEISFIGEIDEMDDQSLLLGTFGTFSSRDRSKLLLRLSEITRVDAGASYERSVAFLAKGSSPVA